MINGNESDKSLVQLVATSCGKYCLQLNVYSYILETVYGYKVRKMFLVRFHDSIDTAEIVCVPWLPTQVKQLLFDRKCSLAKDLH